MIPLVCLDCGEDEEGLLTGWVFIQFSGNGNIEESHECPQCKRLWTLQELLGIEKENDKK